MKIYNIINMKGEHIMKKFKVTFDNCKGNRYSYYVYATSHENAVSMVYRCNIEPLGIDTSDYDIEVNQVNKKGN